MRPSAAAHIMHAREAAGRAARLAAARARDERVEHALQRGRRLAHQPGRKVGPGARVATQARARRLQHRAVLLRRAVAGRRRRRARRAAGGAAVAPPAQGARCAARGALRPGRPACCVLFQQSEHKGRAGCVRRALRQAQGAAGGGGGPACGACGRAAAPGGPRGRAGAAAARACLTPAAASSAVSLPSESLSVAT